MSQDFKINIDADLNTAEAEQKLNALLKEKHKLTIDVDVSGQNTAKKLKQNIENGLKNVKIDTSAMSKSLADSFNITDKSTISKLQKQLNSMIKSLGKSWNGQKFNIGDGFETSMTSVVNTLKKNASKSIKTLWLEWYPEDATYFDMLPYKWDTCYNWISKYINKHDSKFIHEAIKKQRIRQKRELNKKLKYTNTNAYIILIKSNVKRNQLAKYLYVNGAEKRTGDFGSMVAYIKGLKEIPKK